MVLTLSEVRQQIDVIDQKLLGLLEERLLLAEEIARIKAGYDEPSLTDLQREQDMITRLQQLTQHPVLQAEIPHLVAFLTTMTKRLCLLRRQQTLSHPHPSQNIS